MSDQPTPDQLASFDQTLAQLGSNLDALMATYSAELADGEHADISTAGLSEWLVMASGLDHVGMAEHLAAAIRRLHEAGAAYDRGLAEGLRRAVHHVARLLGTRVDMEPNPAEAEAILAMAINDARAEGRRQATEGLERQWGIRGPGGVEGFTSELAARRIAARAQTVNEAVVSRLVGPWEPAPETSATTKEVRHGGLETPRAPWGSPGAPDLGQPSHVPAEGQPDGSPWEPDEPKGSSA